VANHDPFRAYQNLFHHQTEHALTFRDRQGVGCFAQTSQEGLEMLGEREVALTVERPRLKRLELRTEARLLLSKLRHATA